MRLMKLYDIAVYGLFVFLLCGCERDSDQRLYLVGSGEDIDLILLSPETRLVKESDEFIFFEENGHGFRIDRNRPGVLTAVSLKEVSSVFTDQHGEIEEIKRNLTRGEITISEAERALLSIVE